MHSTSAMALTVEVNLPIPMGAFPLIVGQRRFRPAVPNLSTL